MLLVLLGLSVFVSLVFAAWSVETINREVSSAYGDLTLILERLDRIKQVFEHDLAAINRANDAGEDDFVPLPLDEQIDPLLAELEQTAGFGRRVGESTSMLLVSLVRNCKRSVAAYQGATEESPHLPVSGDLRKGAQAEFEAVHALIERVQAQLLGDVELSLAYGRELRSILLRMIIASLALSLLVAFLALILVRRWVLTPIGELREATGQIAAGNLEYRLQVRSSDEFGQLSGEVNHMAEMVVAAQQRLVERERLATIGELVRRLAHSLRNPLAGIRGLAELTREELPPESELCENQARIVSAVDRFERWLADLLSSTTPMKGPFEPLLAKELCRSLEASHAPMARAKRITLKFECEALPEVLHAAPTHMEHALVALLSNAIEATPEGGTVRLRGTLTAGPDGTRWVEIRVEDSGPGVPSDVVGQIFVPNFTTKRHGTGIGLAVVQNVITSHGGRVRVERSADLGGADFIVTFPAGGGSNRLAGDASGQNFGR